LQEDPLFMALLCPIGRVEGIGYRMEHRVSRRDAELCAQFRGLFFQHLPNLPLLAGFWLVSAVGHRVLQSPSHPFPALDATGKKKVSGISVATFHLN
jgi:hypothetical protein